MAKSSNGGAGRTPGARLPAMKADGGPVSVNPEKGERKTGLQKQLDRMRQQGSAAKKSA